MDHSYFLTSLISLTLKQYFLITAVVKQERRTAEITVVWGQGAWLKGRTYINPGAIVSVFSSLFCWKVSSLFNAMHKIPSI